MKITDWVAIIASIIAVVLSFFNLVYFLWDRRSHLKIGITKEYVFEDQQGEDPPFPLGERLWINISNHSIHKVWITKMRAEWTWSYSFPSRRGDIDLIEFRGDDEESWKPISARFWIEPGGDVILSADADVIEYKLKEELKEKPKYDSDDEFFLREKHFHVQLGPSKIFYYVDIQDGYGVWHRSNKLIVRPPGV